MITQDINALKIVQALHQYNENSPENPRHSLLDLHVLLMVFAHPSSSKADLNEMIYGDRQAGKSKLDRPLSRLSSVGWIDSMSHDSASTKLGDGRVTYKLSRSGKSVLQRCC